MEILNYINGSWSKAEDGAFDLYDPSRGEVYGSVPDSGVTEVSAAIKAAKDAFPLWSAMSIDDRSAILGRIADGIEAQLDELAAAESRDNGKPLWLAKAVDIPRAAKNFRFFSHAITQFATEAHVMTGKAINYTVRQPLGVVACISPWNLPLYLFSWKIAPALAAGNTVVAKPSEVTPATAFLLTKICEEAGLPSGVLNVLHGNGEKIGTHLNVHPEVKAISFTGSTRVGEAIAAQCAPLFKKLSLEMGGKNPNIIFADCDFEKMLKNTIRSSFGNQGQICLCGSRIYIERSIYEEFKTHFLSIIDRLKVGHPFAEGTKSGAVVSKAHRDKILSYIKLAKEEGGTILKGGGPAEVPGYENGYYIQPTVIEGLGPNCRVNQEEIFGPVVTLTPFDSEEEALEMANGTPYGLSASVWTENLSRAHRMAENLEAGIVWINCWLLRDLRTPFGGVKQSGVGREGGFDALRFFTEPKNICIEY